VKRRVGAPDTRVDDRHAGWDLPEPFVTRLAVVPADIDAYRHVNNAVYVTWLDRAAWAHSAALGLPIERCLELDRGMAVLRSTLAYLKPALLGDAVDVGTWLLPTDGRLRARRRFQVRHAGDGTTLLRAEIEYVCIELSSGRPTRAPAEFRTRYAATAPTLAALDALPAL
jgi:acyl-CoA thioester hydrolase